MHAVQDSTTRDGSLNARRAMHGSNKLQIGLFGPNCSSGRAVTLVPERWSGNWPDNKRLAQISDDAVSVGRRYLGFKFTIADDDNLGRPGEGPRGL